MSGTPSFDLEFDLEGQARSKVMVVLAVQGSWLLFVIILVRVMTQFWDNIRYLVL